MRVLGLRNVQTSMWPCYVSCTRPFAEIGRSNSPTFVVLDRRCSWKRGLETNGGHPGRKREMCRESLVHKRSLLRAILVTLDAATWER
jgi:hypothetical protein